MAKTLRKNSTKQVANINCPDCKGTGEEQSGVCYCGDVMEGHSVWDNHMATEMTRRCQTCFPPSPVRLADLRIK